MPTTPPTVSTLPTPPQTSDPTNFDARADSFLTALLTWAAQIIALATNVYNNALGAFNDATAGAASSAAAAASVVTAANHVATTAANADLAAAAAGSTVWTSGATYFVGDSRWSPIDRLVYRRIVAGAGTTDPSADATNWSVITTMSQLVDVTGTSYAITSGEHALLSNVAATTVTLPASPLVGDLVWITSANGLRTNVVARNGNKIMAVAEDMTLDSAAISTIGLRYLNSTVGWAIV